MIKSLIVAICMFSATAIAAPSVQADVTIPWDGSSMAPREFPAHTKAEEDFAGSASALLGYVSHEIVYSGAEYSDGLDVWFGWALGTVTLTDEGYAYLVFIQVLPFGF